MENEITCKYMVIFRGQQQQNMKQSGKIPFV